MITTTLAAARLVDPPTAATGLPRHVEEVISGTETRMRAAHATHLGYPYNLTGGPSGPGSLDRYLINNLGDPYIGSHDGSEVCELERETVSWLMDLWQCDDRSQFWGSVGASGTEGNLWALYLAREALPDAVLLHSREAHYSIPKAARILRMPSTVVDCHPSGAIDRQAFDRALTDLAGRPVIVALTCGTTMKGAHDDIGAIIASLDVAGIDRTRRYVHVDGALNAMVLPFVHEAPRSMQPTFRRHAIDSISTSGHKMIGTPMPCGVLVARRSHVDTVASAIAYLRSNDTTLMGSRNGHAVVALWTLLMHHGTSGYRRDVAASLQRTDRMVSALLAAGVPVLRNPHSLTVVFPQPGEAIVDTYQLACNDGDAHAVVMPSVSDALTARFTADYLAWWRSDRQRATHGPSGGARSATVTA